MILGHYKNLGIGYTAQTARKIVDGAAFESSFPVKATGSDVRLSHDATVQETIDFCTKIVLSTLEDTKFLAPKLLRNTVEKTTEAVFAFFYKHYNYRIDKPGVEQLRRPARAWKDRKLGVDCDCFAISVSSVLTNLGIPHSFRVVKMYNKDYFQHIYVVVPKFAGADMSNPNNYYTIDPVVDKPNFEALGITYKVDVKMKGLNGIPLDYLQGIGSPSIGVIEDIEFQEFSPLKNVVNTDLGTAQRAFKCFHKRHLEKNIRDLSRPNADVARLYNVPVLKGFLGEIVNAWENEELLDGVLERLSEREHEAFAPEMAGLGSVLYGSDNDLFYEINETVDGLNGVGDLGRMYQRQNPPPRYAMTASRPKCKCGPITMIKNARAIIEGLGELDDNDLDFSEGFGSLEGKKRKEKRAIKKAKKAAQPKKKGILRKIGKGIKTGAKAYVRTVKKVGKGAGKIIKKVAKAVVKYNPVSLAARQGFLLTLKTNAFKIASRTWGYFTYSEASKSGVSAEFHRKAIAAKDALEKVFVKVLKGDPAVLKKAIVSGTAGRTARKQAATGQMKGLGVAAVAPAAAAAPFIATIVAAFNKIFGKGAKPFSQLINTVKDKASNLVNQDPLPGDETDYGLFENDEPLPDENEAASTYENVVENINDATELEEEDGETLADNSEGEEGTEGINKIANLQNTSGAAKKNNTTAILIGVLAAAGLLYAATAKPGAGTSRKSGLQGVKRNIRKRTIAKSKAKKTLILN